MGHGRADAADRPPPPGGVAAPDFRELYAAYFGFVWRCLRGLGVAERSLDDAAQDVFIAVHRRLSEFRADSSLRTWIYGVVRNVAANHRRSERRRGGLIELDDEAPAAEPSPHEQAQDREAARFVGQFVEQLDDKKRDVFVLALLEQMPIPEVAAILGIPLNTAYTRLRSVRQEFASALSRRKGAVR